MNLEKLRQLIAILLLCTKTWCTSADSDNLVKEVSPLYEEIETYINFHNIDELEKQFVNRLSELNYDRSSYIAYKPAQYSTKCICKNMSYFFLPDQLPVDDIFYSETNLDDSLRRMARSICMNSSKRNYGLPFPLSDGVWHIMSRIGLGLNQRIRFIQHINKNLYRFKDFLKDIQLHYDNFVIDILQYTNKNIRQFTEDQGRNFGRKRLAETIGDVYVQCLKSRNKCSYIMSLDMIDNINNDEKNFLYKAIKHILCIAEVYEDFHIFSITFIKELEKFVESPIGKLKEKNYELDILSKNFVLLWYVYATVHKDMYLLERLYPFVFILFISNFKETSFRAYDIYKQVYDIIVCFYTLVPYYTMDINDGQERIINISITKFHHYKLSGKNVIVDHSYKKCSIQVDLYANPLCNNEFICERLSNESYTEEKNMWEVSPKVQPHYHVQFVDNSKQQLKIVHMPYYLYKNEKAQHKIYLHTIDQICEHIERVFNLPKHNNESTHLYPFKRDKLTGVWSYIDPSDSNRKKTIKCLEAENYNVVFYYIEEGLIQKNFVFAHLQLSDECHPEKDKENNPLHRIPLFFSPLMLSAIPTYPYKYKCNGSPTKVRDYSNLVPNEYVYGEDIEVINKTLSLELRDWTYNKNYHADFFIRKSDAEYEDPGCYVMNTAQREILTDLKSAEITWYVRTPKNACEYMTFVFDKSKVSPHKDLETGEYATDNLIRMLQKKHQSVDIGRFGFCLYYDDASPDEPRVAKVLCPFMKTRLKEIADSITKVSGFVNMVTVKDVDGSMSKFGLHGTILSALMDEEVLK